MVLSKREIKFVGADQSALSKKWLLKFDLYRDGIPTGLIRTAPQYDSEADALMAGKKVEAEYNSTGILPNLFKMF